MTVSSGPCYFSRGWSAAIAAYSTLTQAGRGCPLFAPLGMGWATMLSQRLPLPSPSLFLPGLFFVYFSSIFSRNWSFLGPRYCCLYGGQERSQKCLGWQVKRGHTPSLRLVGREGKECQAGSSAKLTSLWASMPEVATGNNFKNMNN